MVSNSIHVQSNDVSSAALLAWQMIIEMVNHLVNGHIASES